MTNVTELRPNTRPEFVAVPRDWIESAELTGADLGVLIRIATLLERDRPITIQALTRPGQATDATRRIVNRLIDAGYLERARVVNSARFRGVRYRILTPE